MDRVVALIMAGGPGDRLQPLTRERSKAAVPFGGKFRIIDFTLSNCVNSGVRRVYVLTQYRSESLNRHIQNGWSISSSGLGDFIYCVPAQQKLGAEWYKGTADAVRQNLNLVNAKNADDILVLGGDHIYKMNYVQMIDYHRRKKAALTVSAVRERKERVARTLGVLEVDQDYRLVGFQEKPEEPKTLADAPDFALASMGVYIFKVGTLIEILQGKGDDFGHHVIPEMIGKHDVYVYDFEQENKIEDFLVRRGRRRPGEGAGGTYPRFVILAGCRHHRPVLQGQHGPRWRRSSLQSLRGEVDIQDIPEAAATKQVRARRQGPGVYRM